MISSGSRSTSAPTATAPTFTQPYCHEPAQLYMCRKHAGMQEEAAENAEAGLRAALAG